MRGFINVVIIIEFIAYLILALYLLAFALVCVYGLHRYVMVQAFLRARRTYPLETAAPYKGTAGSLQSETNIPDGDSACASQLGTVTVQLPMYNERHVASRIIRAAAALDWPSEKLQIQVLDDSTDSSAQIARRTCEELSDAGVNIQYIHRTNRQGYKAGALANGMKSASGEYIAIFDADFVPAPDFLRRTIPEFDQPGLGMVQARWSHLNRERSILTRVQAIFLDAHFIVEQSARASTGKWFNFNGTAGVWRRTCIDAAGGWQHDTLTEDTDLSYRAQLAGWRFKFLNHVACPAELPPTVSAFLSQQHRWQKGLVQTAMKLLPTILRSPTPLRTRMEAFFHLTSPLLYLLVLLMIALLPGIIIFSDFYRDLHPHINFALTVIFPFFGICSTTTFYLASQLGQGRSLLRTVCLLPALFAIGTGLTCNNSRAVLEALFRRQSPFIRT
ncbi:MAG TPA: glycosyltransferase, partial [Phycisphaerales bacterium]|nr:glycosyltransferase [Phycisphaerales bacterium]